jgi:hypothetical protein
MLPQPRPPAPQDDARDPHLGTALAAAAGRVAPETVDQVWLFPRRAVGNRESALAVLVVVPPEDAARRTIWTVRYEIDAPRGQKPTRTERVEEQGTVPPDRVDRIIDGVLRRLEGGEADAPDVRELRGDLGAWTALLSELGAAAVDPPNR